MELEELADDLIGAAGRGETPFGVYLIDADDPLAELPRSVERQVFLEFFGNTAEMLELEYGPYDHASRFLCVMDHVRRRPAGVIRIIEPGAVGLKSLHDLEQLWAVDPHELVGPSGARFDPDDVWDLATLAVAPDYRSSASGGLISMALYQALNMLGARRGVKWAVAVMDLVVLDLINSAWHRPFAGVPGAEPRRYLDSPASVPVFCEVAEYEARLAFLDPATHEILFEGRGLESLVSTPAWHPTATRDPYRREDLREDLRDDLGDDLGEEIIAG
jgi:hypothetical protein